MIGSALAHSLVARGDEVVILTRREARSPSEMTWDPSRGIPDVGRLEGLDALFNLSGAPIGDRPWTRARRKVLWETRIDATDVLLKSLGKLTRPPRVFIGAGGLGRFGDR